MLNFNEEFLQFIWRHRLLLPKPLLSQNGLEIQVLKPGEQNADSGPDFFNAQIRVNGTLLAGNVEIHLRTSDWLKHKHQFDKSYDTLVLHVVYEHDVDLPQNQQHQVEVLELRSWVAPETIEAYQKLIHTKEELPCARHLPGVEAGVFAGWLERMLVERLEKKQEAICRLFDSSRSDFAQTFYVLFVKNMGFKVNAVPFEWLAQQLPLQVLLRHSDDLFQVEALLLGMAGLLSDQHESAYVRHIQNEFEFLRQKYNLVPLDKQIFKFSKLRPANFPTLRLAQLARLVHKNPRLFTSPHVLTTYAGVKQALQVPLEGYWLNHYDLDGHSQDRELTIGTDSQELIMINTFVPFFFFYARKTGHAWYAEQARQLLSTCKFENNKKTRLFEAQKAHLKNAAQSQACIQLHDNFCRFKKCLKCGIAAGVLGRQNDARHLKIV